MSEEWEPDFVMTPAFEMSHFAKVYLNGELLENCYETRVKWTSFESDTFGEVIVAATREGQQVVPAIMSKPRLGEFTVNGALAHFIAGRVRIDLSERGKQILEVIKRAYDVA